MTRRRATSIEVAERAGVSQSAVSRCFTNGASISDETRRRVLEAARELGYRPNALARGLTTRRSNLVGVVMGDLDGPFQPYLFEKITRGLAALGKQPLLIRGDPVLDIGGPTLAAVDYQVEAVLLTAGSVSPETIRDVQDSGTPLVLYGRAVVEDGVDSVCCDNRAGARLAAFALAAAGHRRIGYIAGRTSAFSESQRRSAFFEAIEELGLPRPAIGQGDYGYESGYQQALQLLEDDPSIEALFCGNDAMAFGALAAARDRLHRRVPEDLSIVGFDDVPMAAWSAFDLTTIRNPVDMLVKHLLRLVERRLADPDADPLVEICPPSLVRRSSARL